MASNADRNRLSLRYVPFNIAPLLTRPIPTLETKDDGNRAAEPKRRRTRFGTSLIFVLLSCVFFSSQTLCVRLVGVDPVFSFMVRCVVQIALCVPCILHSSSATFWGLPGQKKWLVVVGLFSSLTVAAEYYAFQNMPIGDATVLVLGAAPVFTGILGWLLLREKWPVLDIIAALLSAVGVALIARPDFIFRAKSVANQTNATDLPTFSVPRGLPIVIALCAALTTAFGFLAVRKLKKKVDFLTVLFYSALIGGLGSVVWFFIKREDVFLNCNFKEARALLLCIGISGFLGQVTCTRALQLENAATVASIRYLDVVLGFLLELALFREEITAYSVAGAAIILGSTVTVSAHKLRRSRSKI
ncbi:solute carrier family 35 member G1-like [Oscarella lobularis]|uniref:solute carrier family 35 member G1-like n=1 Tax=Oscarella lobularis TaxID=121494 RepID=UPI003313F103